MKIDPNLKEDLKQYIQNRITHQKSVVTLISPYKLSNEEIQSFMNHLPLLKDAEIKQEINTDIMAGVIIKFGSKMIDLSLTSELQKLQQKLYEIT
jgi:F0F1-type ATP synthase delta subunit